MTWLTTFIDSSCQNFIEYPFRHLFVGELFWFMSMTFTGGATGTPLPIVFALTAAFLDPTSVGDFTVLYDPALHSPRTADIIIDSVDCNLDASTKPYMDMSPLWLIGIAIHVTIVVMLGNEYLH